jgi:fructokinase
VITGPNGIAGEWGHNSLPWPDGDETPGPSCYCGKRGCIETFLSGPGMAADHERRTGRREPAPAIASAALEGDAASLDTLSRYEHRMARALAGVINVLDPDVIVLGGGMSNIERLYENVPVIWTAYVFGAVGSTDHGPAAAFAPRASAPREAGHDEQREPVRTRLVRARHGDSSGVRGAAWLWGAG